MHNKTTALFLCSIAFLVTACAGLDFGEKGLAYNQPKPYLFVSVNKECISSATIISIPGTEQHVKFKPGFGSSDLSITLTNGMIASAGQKVDTKIPDTITAFASLGTAVAGIAKDRDNKAASCQPSANLYPITDGIPDHKKPINFPVDLANPVPDSDR